MQSNSPLGRPGAPGGPSGHRPDEKSWNIENLGVILVPKMAFLGSGTDAISSKFGSDALKIKQFSIRTLAKFEFERDVFFFLGVGGRGRSPWKSADPEGRGWGRGGQQEGMCSKLGGRKKELKTIV